MKPILFSENSTTFTTNGIGRLSDAFECVVTEERNGIYELEMTYPMEGAHYSDIAIRKIIVAKPSANASPEPFRVYKITKPINGKVKIYAQHISYDLSKNTTMPFTVAASATACNTTLQGLKSNAVETCPFTFWTDVTTVASYNQKIPASIKQRLGGIEGSVLDQFGGEYEYVGLTVKLWRSRGSQRDITLRYGKNITDLQQEENIANTVTGVVPFWTDIDNTSVVTLTEKAVYSSHASQYSNKLTVPLDLSQEWENQPTQTQLRDAATIYVNQDNFGIPTVSTKVDFVNLADTEEYKDILPLQNVNLCDTIKVQFEKLGINTTAKIVKTTYNVLAERYDSIEVGSLRSNLASTITDIEKNSASSIEKNGKRIFAEANSEAQDIVNSQTAWLTSADGYVIARKDTDGSWKELIFADHKDPAQWVNILLINENGIGFSSDGGATFRQAWTLDGNLHADFITTGLLKSRDGKNYIDLDNNRFVLAAGTAAVNYDTTDYSGAYVPTNSNSPASSWDASTKPSKVGKTFYDTLHKLTYVYRKTYPETEHPYSASQDIYYVLSGYTDNQNIRVTFDNRSKTERPWDRIDIYYNTGSSYKYLRLSGTIPSSIVIPHPSDGKIYIYWHADSGTQDWGWKITNIDYTSDTETSGWTTATLPQETWVEWETYKWIQLTLDEYVTDGAEGAIPEYSQEEIFNILTNNGQTQGIYLQNGRVYLNAEYMGAGALKIGGSNYTAIPSITVYNSQNNILFQASASGVQVNSGIITLKDGNNNIVFQASPGGVIWNSENSNMASNGTISSTGTFQDLLHNQHTALTEFEKGGLTIFYDGDLLGSLGIEEYGAKALEVNSTTNVILKGQGVFLRPTDELEITTPTLSVEDDQGNYGTGYTGRINGMNFINGIFVN